LPPGGKKGKRKVLDKRRTFAHISEEMRTEPCPKCGGTGKIISQRALGEELRALRKKRGVSLRRMAELLDVSAPYLSDLELGRRAWSDERASEYKSKLSPARLPNRRKK